MKNAFVIVLVFLSVVLVAGYANAAIIAPEDILVTGYGEYYNTERNISDGFIPEQGAWWTSAECTWWTGPSPYFVLDLGNLYTLEKIATSVDNNDDYYIDFSADGNNWSALHTIYSWQWDDYDIWMGMDTFTDIPVNASARYLKIYANGGDGAYSIGELNAYTRSSSTVPEPATVALFGIGGLLMTLIKRNRER
ncbi:MAG TPA: PEP-CTERM sorting domain-containing protein [Candidatus Omnitrophota bacterium]|nr:PEP-CTERM sorting domain-containing protein [Candidatus Omnitrophota bacterium]